MSAARVDHVMTAKKILAGFDTLQTSHEITAAGTFAMAHATLALAEQQRIANLITIAGWVVDAGKDDVRHDLNTLGVGQADAVWEALGLS